MVLWGTCMGWGALGTPSCTARVRFYHFEGLGKLFKCLWNLLSLSFCRRKIIFTDLSYCAWYDSAVINISNINPAKAGCFFTWYFILLFSLFIITDLVIIISRVLSIIRSFFDLSQSDRRGELSPDSGAVAPREITAHGGAGAPAVSCSSQGQLFHAGMMLFSGEAGGRHLAEVCKGPAEPWLDSAENLCQPPAVPAEF